MRDVFAIRIERLETELEFARQEINRLKAALAVQPMKCPQSWGLTRAESLIVGLLMTSDYVSRDRIVAAIPPVYNPCRDDRTTVDVLVCRTRAKIKPIGVAIKSIRGVGYKIAPEHKSLVRKAVAFSLGE